MMVVTRAPEVCDVVGEVLIIVVQPPGFVDWVPVTVNWSYDGGAQRVIEYQVSSLFPLIAKVIVIWWHYKVLAQRIIYNQFAI